MLAISQLDTGLNLKHHKFFDNGVQQGNDNSFFHDLISKKKLSGLFHILTPIYRNGSSYHSGLAVQGARSLSHAY